MLILTAIYSIYIGSITENIKILNNNYFYNSTTSHVGTYSHILTRITKLNKIIIFLNSDLVASLII